MFANLIVNCHTLKLLKVQAASPKRVEITGFDWPLKFYIPVIFDITLAETSHYLQFYAKLEDADC